jgi:starch phosphorylase
MNLARYMVRGVDMWLNTPRRPMEASGTSGMKAAFNGALNMSTFDGWWCEGYRPDGGWVIGAGEDYEDAAYQDMVESKAIYNMLENEIIPLFYKRSADGLPRAWIQRMKNSIKYITPRFSTYRMFADYMCKFYVPAARRWHELNADEMQRAKSLSQWNAKLRQGWSNLSIKDVQVRIAGTNGNGKLKINNPCLKVGQKLEVRALVDLGRLNAKDVSVELYNGAVDTWGHIPNGSTAAMKHEQPGEGNDKQWFVTELPCERSGNMGMAVRIVPKHSDLVSPWEPGLILWEGEIKK